MELINLEQNTPEWHEYRLTHYNASETPAVMKLSPFEVNSPEDVARVKKGFKKVFYNSAMKQGHDLEPVMREYAELATGEILEPCVGRQDRFSASFDGITFDCDLISEYKASKNTFNHVTEHGEPPYHYYMQVQHQLMVSGAKKCLFVVINPETSDIRTCDIFPDKNSFGLITDAWAGFDDVMESVQPEEGARTDEEWLDLSAEYISLQNQKAAIDERMAEIKSELDKLAGHESAKGGGITFIVTKGRKTVDYEKAATTYLSDEALEKYKTYDFKKASGALKPDQLKQFTNVGSDTTSIRVK